MSGTSKKTAVRHAVLLANRHHLSPLERWKAVTDPRTPPLVRAVLSTTPLADAASLPIRKPKKESIMNNATTTIVDTAADLADATARTASQLGDELHDHADDARVEKLRDLDQDIKRTEEQLKVLRAERSELTGFVRVSKRTKTIAALAATGAVLGAAVVLGLRLIARNAVEVAVDTVADSV